MEDLVQSLTRGNPGSVKTVLAAVVLALAGYQVVLAAIGYRAGSRPALLTHRASGDAIVVRGWLPFGGALPYLGTTVFALLAATCFTSPWFDS